MTEDKGSSRMMIIISFLTILSHLLCEIGLYAIKDNAQLSEGMIQALRRGRYCVLNLQRSLAKRIKAGRTRGKYLDRC